MSVNSYQGSVRATVQDAGSKLAQHVLLVDASGNAVVFGSGGTSAADGASYAQNTTVGTPMIGVYSASDRTIADGKLAVPSIDATGALKVVGATGGGGGGTEYTEDAASAANPVGGMLILRRRDTLNASEVSADGDNIAASATAKGELCVNASALPLPSGAATESTISAISGDLGDSADAEATGNGSLIAVVKRLRSVLNQIQFDTDFMVSTVCGAVGVPGAGTPTEGMAVMGHDGTNARILKVDTSGLLALQGVGVEDAAETAGGNLMMAGAVRRDTPASSSGTTGDNSTINVSKSGGVWSAALAEAAGGVDFKSGSIAATKTDIGTANTPTGLFGWYFYNPNASAAYVQIFNAQASAVTLGTTTPDMVITLPAGAGANVMNPLGIKFGTALSIAVTTTRTGSTGVGSTVDYTMFYKQ
jgi:hypothetical protein